MARGGSAGPTGAPWVDSNGSAIRLNRALHPDAAVWVDAPPTPKTFITADSYLIAIADSAAYGGRWIIALDEPLTRGLASRDPQSLEIWDKVTATAGFFAAHAAWPDYQPVALAGVISDFEGDNEFFSRELLNLMGRAGLHYRVLPKGRISPASFAGLRAVTYIDAAPPNPEVRQQVLRFVESGGLLIAAPNWGAVEGAPLADSQLAGYRVYPLSKGRIALAEHDPADPYSWATDAGLLISHRYDLVRFWNSGAACSFYTMAPGGKQALVHLLFYAMRGPDSATVRVAGRYRVARASTIDKPAIDRLAMAPQANGVEVRLPQVSQYVALELDV